MLDRAVLTTCAVQLDDKRITGLAADKVVRKGVALLPEGRRVFGPLSVLENLRLGAYSAPRDGGETLETVFSMFPILRQRRSGAAGLLSGGEQQMLAFGRALMSQPRIMMLDEPSMGLAPAMVKKVAASVRQMADSGIGILMVEQNAEIGLEVANDVVVVARGEVVFTGSVVEARTNSSVLLAFLGEAVLASPNGQSIGTRSSSSKRWPRQ